VRNSGNGKHEMSIDLGEHLTLMSMPEAKFIIDENVMLKFNKRDLIKLTGKISDETIWRNERGGYFILELEEVTIL
jgi:hypothetical protein